MIPSWLARGEGYEPKSDRDGFIDKSILSLLGALAGIRNRPGRGHGGPRLGTHPALKLATAFLVVLLVSLSRNLLFLGIVVTGELAYLASLSGEAIAAVLGKGLAAAAFAFVIFLPSALWGNWQGVVMTTSKVLISIVAVAMVSATTPWASMSRAFASFRVPDLFIMVLDIAVKYISLLGGLVLDMLYALKVRSVGRNGGKAESLSGVAGTVFLKSREAAEEMYAAMECRGFSGTYRTKERVGFRPIDLSIIAMDLSAILAFFYLGVR
jgi:cobalt/nickel transport system permease protein